MKIRHRTHVWCKITKRIPARVRKPNVFSSLLMNLCLFPTLKWSKSVEETHKNSRKTNTFPGFLHPPTAKESLPVAAQRHLPSTYVLESDYKCQHRTIFGSSCLCFVFVPASCLAVSLPRTLSGLTLPRPPLRALCLSGIGSVRLAWPWICSCSPTSFPSPSPN